MDKISRLKKKETNLVSRGNKAVDEGREQKADRLLRKADRIGSRSVKLENKKTLPKAQKGKQVSGMYDFQNIYTGPDSTSPGVLKAKADKKKADANILIYKKKLSAQKQVAMKKAQFKKKG